MKLVLERKYKSDNYTIGKLHIDGNYFCDTLEDKDRGLNTSMPLAEIQKIKVKHKTAIPIGTYKIGMNIISPKYCTSPLYKNIRGRLPRLLNVPGYEGVLIHIGNTPDDTSGCILVGANKIKGQVINSTDTFNKLYEKLNKAHLKGEEILIQIV